MLRKNTMSERISAAAIILVVSALISGLRANAMSPAATRVLSFPSGQCTGSLYLEPESGPGWDPKCVRLYGEWEYLAAAQGKVPVPGGRNVQLLISLSLAPHELARLRAQNPRAYQLTTADRVRKDPEDLSGLSQLDPNDLYRLSVNSAMYRRTGTDPDLFEPISNLTGLRMLRLSSTGITDKGLEHLRPLRSLRALELMESSITSRGLAVLKDLPALEYLDLGEFAADAGLKYVGQHPNLRWLRILLCRHWMAFHLFGRSASRPTNPSAARR